MSAANELGAIETIGGRRCRFNRWEINEFTREMKTLGQNCSVKELEKIFQIILIRIGLI